MRHHGIIALTCVCQVYSETYLNIAARAVDAGIDSIVYRHQIKR